MRGDAQISHDRRPSKTDHLRAGGTGVEKCSSRIMETTGLVGCIKEDVGVDREAHALRSPSRILRTVSLSLRSTLARIDLDRHEKRGAFDLLDRSSPRACASRSEINRPRDLPSVSWRRFRSRKTGPSMFTVVRGI